ncbi:Ubiquinone biosynthesis O-methyltransferase, mitochondrial [subsurface metagenome]
MKVNTKKERLLKKIKRHLKRYLFRRSYYFKRYQETRNKFNSITTTMKNVMPDILALERHNPKLEDLISKWPRPRQEEFMSYNQVVIRLLKNTLRNHSDIDDMRVLDVGCSDGYLLELIKNKTSIKENQLYGLEIQRIRFVLARDRINNSNFVNASALDLPFKNDSFDIVIATEVLEHLTQPNVYIRELYRVLKNKGFFVISTPSKHTHFIDINPLSIIEAIVSLYIPSVLPPFHNLYEPDSDQPRIHRAFTFHELKAMLKQFQSIRIQSINYSHPLFIKFRKIMPKLPIAKKLGDSIVIAGSK